jgi:hypothetical protein
MPYSVTLNSSGRSRLVDRAFFGAGYALCTRQKALQFIALAIRIGRSVSQIEALIKVL